MLPGEACALITDWRELRGGRLNRLPPDGFACAVVALSAARADHQFELRFVEAGAAALCGADDVSVEDGTAAVDHDAQL
jgi:hypothetical protein